ncbi:DUF6789 family protein [Paenibacillus alkalitolerans]|uniref:DUF6789 family protein n=1 Tax=Paenibacillus alkalitolerans TaxID=2799335 RepID=UPI0018F48F9F|nr:DUF6789 family protein [Paenibacillus alkalitolerans]
MKKTFAALFLSTGAALLVYVMSGISLLATTFVILICALVIGSFIWRKSSENKRLDLKRRVVTGLIAGALATALYDVFRFLLIKITGIMFWPFDIFNIFGKALVGAEQAGFWVTILGFVFHIANGIGFGIAYTIAFGERGIWMGILWAMILEAMMVTVYPGWLGLKALDEFLSVSVFGHFVYGITLGYMAKRLILRKEVAS